MLVESRSSCFWCGIPVVLDSIGLKNYYNNTMHVKTQQKQYCLYFVNEEIGWFLPKEVNGNLHSYYVRLKIRRETLRKTLQGSVYVGKNKIRQGYIEKRMSKSYFFKSNFIFVSMYFISCVELLDNIYHLCLNVGSVLDLIDVFGSHGGARGRISYGKRKGFSLNWKRWSKPKRQKNLNIFITVRHI